MKSVWITTRNCFRYRKRTGRISQLVNDANHREEQTKQARVIGIREI